VGCPEPSGGSPQLVGWAQLQPFFCLIPDFCQYVNSLVPAATKFAELYDASRTAQVSGGEHNQAQDAIDALRLAIRGWLGALSRDIPGFDIASYTDRQLVPDDVIGSGQRLMEVCRTFKDRSGQPLPYQEAMVQALAATIEKAETEWAQAQDRRAVEQTMRDEFRAAAVLLQKELVAFRRALRAVLGATHVDLHALRAQPGLGVAEEVEEEVVDDAVDPLGDTQESVAVTPSVVTNGASSNGFQKEAVVA